LDSNLVWTQSEWSATRPSRLTPGEWVRATPWTRGWRRKKNFFLAGIETWKSSPAILLPIYCGTRESRQQTGRDF
jgi:hypothetical protein